MDGRASIDVCVVFEHFPYGSKSRKIALRFFRAKEKEKAMTSMISRTFEKTFFFSYKKMTIRNLSGTMNMSISICRKNLSIWDFNEGGTA